MSHKERPAYLKTVASEGELMVEPKPRGTSLEMANAQEMLKKYCPPGTEIHCVIRSVAKSGISRRISFFVITEDRRIQHIGGWIARIFGKKLGNDLDIRVDGCGMDMGFHIVSQLSRELYGSDYELTSHWI